LVQKENKHALMSLKKLGGDVEWISPRQTYMIGLSIFVGQEVISG
jgi:hypothetical protein